MMKNLFDFGLIDPLEEKHEHRMAETSIQAYHTVVKPNLGHMHKIIHEIIINNPGCSNADILNILNKEHPRSNGRRWRICSITGRAKELREKHMVMLIGSKIDPDSGQRVHTMGGI